MYFPETDDKNIYRTDIPLPDPPPPPGPGLRVNLLYTVKYSVELHSPVQLDIL